MLTLLLPSVWSMIIVVTRSGRTLMGWKSRSLPSRSSTGRDAAKAVSAPERLGQRRCRPSLRGELSEDRQSVYLTNGEDLLRLVMTRGRVSDCMSCA
jgi:hypothetical protein